MSPSDVRYAPCSLDVLIVGAGFAGLAAAYTLSRAGHKVRVLDQQPRFGTNVSDRTAGIKVGPNLTRVIKDWGLADALDAVTRVTARSGYVSLETGETLNYLHWEDPVMKSTGGEMRVGLYDDVLRLVYDLAVRHGAEVLYEHKVLAYESRSAVEKPVVVLQGGKTMSADFVVNAAGIASLATISTEFETMKDWRPIGFSAYTMVISGEKMQQDTELNKLLHTQEWPAWMGSHRLIMSYPVRQNTAYVIEMIWPDSHAKPWPANAGTDWIDWSIDAVDFSGCEPRMDRLLRLCTSIRRTRCLSRKEPLADWVNEAGRIVVIGDAAHPIYPCMLSTVPLAVEDANALGTLLSHISSPSALHVILSGYQDIRQPACDMACATELARVRMVSLPPGPERDARDAALRAERDRRQEPSEDELREKWEELGIIYAHDATEAAEDWWAKWGRLSVGKS